MFRPYQAVLAGVGTEQIDVAFSDLPGCVTVAVTLEEVPRWTTLRGTDKKYRNI